MTPQQEAAMRQALEALKLAQQIIGHPDDDHSKLIAEAITVLTAALEQPLAMQVRPSEFVKLVAGKENMTGIPAYFAEWPNHD